MKIANIVCTYPPYRGGIGTAAKEFAELMEKEGHEVTTITADYGDKDDKKDDQVNGEARDGGLGHEKKKIVRLKTLIKHGNGAFLPQLFWSLKEFDYIYLNYPFFGAQEIIWFLLKFFSRKKKLIIRYHMDVVGLSFFSKFLSFPSKLIFNSLFKRANLIITASLDYVQNGDLGQIYKNNKEKFVEIPYGVDINKFKPEGKKENDILKILFVGGLDKAHYFKGVDILLEALKELNKENTSWNLTVIGDGDLKQDYERKAVNLGFMEKINFLGKVSDKELPEKYRDANVLILPSVNKCEAFGIVLLEAMASGTPVIASNLAGVRSVFEDGKQGLIVEPNKVFDLVEKIKYLIDNKDKRKEMEMKARNLAEEKYNWGKIGETINKALSEL